MSRIRTIARKLNHRAAAAITACTTVLTMLAVPALSSATGTSYDLSPAVSGVTDQITAVLTVALPIAGGLIALFVGWKLLKRMVKGA